MVVFTVITELPTFIPAAMNEEKKLCPMDSTLSTATAHDELTPFLLRHTQPDTMLLLEDGPFKEHLISTSLDFSKPATLFVASDHLYWFNESAGKGLCISYNAIILHAVSTADPITPPSVYCQVDMSNSAECEGPAFGNIMMIESMLEESSLHKRKRHNAASDRIDEDSDSLVVPDTKEEAVHDASEIRETLFESPEDMDDIDAVLEMRFQPIDKSCVNQLYQAITDCSMSHVCDDDEEEETEEFASPLAMTADDALGSGYFFTADSINQLTPEVSATLQRLDSLLQVPEYESFPATEESL